MLLVADVGNTQTNIGAFDGDDLVADWRFATEAEATYDELALILSPLLAVKDLTLAGTDGSVLATVVPALGPAYVEMFDRHTGGECVEVDSGAVTGMPILVERPAELGPDRIANALAVYDRVKGPCAAVDFGTSTNFDVVSAQGEFLGGAIGPGFEVSIEALSRRAARLPRIELAKPATAIGRNTETAMQSGFVNGFAGLVDGIARRVDSELGGGATFIATGGLAPVIAPHCETIDEIDQLLTLTGLRLVWESNR